MEDFDGATGAEGMSGPKLTVVSLGAGVQSSTMALMAARGEITPMPDCAIFADTQAEPKHVYDWLDWIETQLPFPVYRVAFLFFQAVPLLLLRQTFFFQLLFFAS